MEEKLRDLWAEGREVSLGRSGRVDRLESAPSALRFLREYVSANKPCIVSRSGTVQWPALSLWGDDGYLCRALGDQSVSVHLTPDGRADSVVPLPGSGGRMCFASALVRRMGLPEALRVISGGSGSSSSPVPVPVPVVGYAQQQNDCFRAEYSGLAGDVEGHIPWASEALGCLPEAVNLWIGNDRSETSFHKDHYENLYAVVTGEKHFLLLPPTELHRLYVRPYPAARYTESLELELEEPGREVPWCSVDPFPHSPDDIQSQTDSFPLYFNHPAPPPFQCTVKAGEILYL